MKVSNKRARQIARAALAELIAALQVEGADHRAHRARLRHGVHEPGAEQRNLEQEQQLDVLVLEQLLDHVERLPLGRRQEVAADVALARSSASRSACGSGSENRSGRKIFAVISSALRFQSRKVCASFLEKRATLASVSSRSRPKIERRAVEMRLAELIARRDVFDAVAEVEILEPRRLADVEMIDRMQVVIEARRGRPPRSPARRRIAGGGPPAGCRARTSGEIGAEHQAVVAGADDDAVVGSDQGCGMIFAFESALTTSCRLCRHPRLLCI